MIWPKRSVEPDGSRAAVDLRTTVGQPGRLSFAEGITGSRMAHLPCTIRKVDRSEIRLDMPDATTRPPAESAVILEVATGHALLQCFTTVRSVGQGAELVLRTPARPHIVQRRRFPRVDLFLSITLHTPDRPIEEVAAQMINLSMDGAACVMVEPMQPGEVLTLNLANVGFFPPEVKAAVRRCTPSPSRLWIVGLQFQGLRPEQELYLAKYLADFVDQTTT